MESEIFEAGKWVANQLTDYPKTSIMNCLLSNSTVQACVGCHQPKCRKKSWAMDIERQGFAARSAITAIFLPTPEA